MFFKGFKYYNLKKLIEDTPTSKIRSIAMGPVEVYGKVLSIKDKVLFSPFSNAKCVYFQYWIDEWRKKGKNSHGWVTVKQGMEGSPFFLKDSTGKVMTDPTKAEVDIPEDFSRESGMGNDPSDLMKKFMKSQGIGFQGLFGINKKMRYRESYLAPGDEVFIMGNATDNPYIEEGNATDEFPDIMIQNGSGMFYISDKPEKTVISTLRWKYLLGLFGGGALIIGGLAYILLEMGLLF